MPCAVGSYCTAARSAKPAKRPSAAKVAELALDLQPRLHQDIETGRAQLIRWLRNGKLQVRRIKPASDFERLRKDETRRAVGGLRFRLVSRSSSGGNLIDFVSDSKLELPMRIEIARAA